MSYVSPDLGEDFSARVIFMLDGPIPLRWATTHEFSTNVGGSSANIDAFVATLLNFHQMLLLEPYQIEKIVVSTLAVDGSPYDPLTFKVYEEGVFGTRAIPGTDPYMLEACLLITRVVSSGRNGHILLRGMLGEGDISSSGGRVALADLSAIQTEVATALGDSALDAYMAPALPEDVQLYTIRPGLLDNDERPISNFLPKRLTTKKLNNKYFDRA
jgi:hypothetical protein